VDELLVNKPADFDLPEVLRGSNYTRENLIKWVTIVRVDHYTGAQASKLMRPVTPTLREGPEPIDPDAIVNAAKLAWDIIKDNKPNYNEQGNDYACAIPQGASWQQLTGWQAGETSTAREQWVNGFDITVVDISWKARFRYGGQIDGVGAYITNVEGVVESNYELWPVNVNVQVKISPPLNIGTEEDPIAQLEARVEGSGGTGIVHNGVTYTYTFQGDGYWEWRKNSALAANIVV